MAKLKCTKLNQYEEAWLTVEKEYDGEQVFGSDNPLPFPAVLIKKDDTGYPCYSSRDNFLVLRDALGV